jgi:hypothetical protein
MESPFLAEISTSGTSIFRLRLSSTWLGPAWPLNVAIAAPGIPCGRTRSKPTSFSPVILSFAFCESCARPPHGSPRRATFPNRQRPPSHYRFISLQ